VTLQSTSVSEQPLGKHVPAPTNTHTEIELLLETGVSTRSVQRGYKEENRGYPVQSRVNLQDGVQPAMAWALEAEESPLLEAITRERLVETQQAGKVFGRCGDLGIVEISGGDVIACSSESCV
jgi:hypothetical protein